MAVLSARNEGTPAFKGFASDFEAMLSKIAGRQITIDPVVIAKGAGIAAIAATLVEITKLAHALGEEWDNATDTIIIKTGATGDALTGLQNDFEKVFGTVATGDSGAVAKALGDIARRTDQTGESLQGLTRQEVELARLTGEDLGTQIQATTRLFGDWSVSTEHQSETLDKLLVASQKSGASISTLSQNVVQFGAPMRALGIDLDTSISLFAKWEKEGVNVETVAGTMRIAVARLSEAGLEPNAVFQDLLTTIRDMPDSIQATNLAMSAFGQKGGADMAAAIREGRFSVDDFVKALGGAKGAINDTKDATDDGAQKIQESMNKLKVAFAPVGVAVFSMASDVISAFANMVETATTKGEAIEERARKIREAALGGEVPDLANLNPITGGIAAGAGLVQIESSFADAGVNAAKAFWERVNQTPGLSEDELRRKWRPGAELTQDWADAGEDAADAFADALGDEISDSIDAQLQKFSVLSLKPFEDAFSRELERIDLESQFGEEGAAAIQAFSHAVEGDPKSSEAIGRAGARLIESLRKSTLPAAEQLAADIAATLRASFESPTDVNAGAAALAAQQAAGAALVAQRAAEEEKRRIADAQRDSDEARRKAEQAAKDAANIPIVGFMETLAQNRAGFVDQFGELGAGAATALSEAFRERTASSGASVAREVENIVLQLRRENVPNWRELGDDLAGAFHDALIKGTDQAKLDALAKLDEITAAMKSHRGLNPENLLSGLTEALNAQSLGGGAGILDSFTKAFEEGGEQNRQALARTAASWLAEVQKGLGPDRAQDVMGQFLQAITSAATDNGPDARAALEDIFRTVNFEIPTAAIDKTLDQTLDNIQRVRTEALLAAQSTRDIADATKIQQGDLQASQAERLRALEASFPSGRQQQADKTAQQIADAQKKGIEDVNAARFAGDSRAVTAAQLATQKQVEGLQKQATEQEAQANQRETREQAIAALREQFATENANLEKTLQNEAYDRQIFQINERARLDGIAAQAKHDADIQGLNDMLTLADQVKAITDSWFNTALDDLNQLIDRAPSLASALGALPGGTGLTPQSAAGKTINGPLFTLINQGNIGSEGAPEEINAVIQASLQQLAAGL